MPLLDFTQSLMPSVPMRHLGWGSAPCTHGARCSRDRWSEHNVVSVSYKQNLLWTACRCTDEVSVFLCFSRARSDIRLKQSDACLPSLFSVEVCRPGASTLMWHFLKCYIDFFKATLHVGHHSYGNVRNNFALPNLINLAANSPVIILCNGNSTSGS